MKAIVLAAGKGTRLQSEAMELPKALRLLKGKPLIRYVLENLGFLRPQDITIVVGFRKEQVMAELGDAYNYVEQMLPLNGTARATLSAEPVVGKVDEPVLIAYCDMPFLSRETYELMFSRHIASGAGNTLLAGKVVPPPPYGRLIRDEQGTLVDIIEESACTEEQKKIDEVNVGIQVMDGMRMWDWLRQVKDDNPKKEYYLTSIAGVLSRLGVKQEVVLLADNTEMLGINTMEDLALAESILDERAKG